MSVINKENKKNLSNWIDDLVKLKNPILETADGWVFSILINVLDDNLLSKLNEKYWPMVDNLSACIAKEDWNGASEQLGAIMSEAIKTPLVDGTPEELEMYTNVFKLIASLIKNKFGK